MVHIRNDMYRSAKQRMHIFKAHRLLSYLYSYFLMNSGKTGYSITDISTSEIGVYSVKAVKSTEDVSIYHVLRLMVSPDPPASYDESYVKFFTEEDSGLERNTLMEKAILIDDEKKLSNVQDSDLLGDITVLGLSDSRDNISTLRGNFSDRSLSSSFSKSERNVFQMFPVPYVPGMNPMITISFLTQNFTVTGWNPQREIIAEAADYAHRYSPYLDLERLTIDMQVVMKICIRIGLFKENGDMISMPRSRTRAQSWFSSGYNDYLRKIGRKTLYDYSSL